MIKPHLSVVSSDSSGKLEKLLNDLKKQEVYVGITEEEAPREDSNEINNAQLMYIHTNGSPLKGIPARPVIEPAIEAPDNKNVIADKLGAAAKGVLNGKPEEAKEQLNLAGMEGQNRCKSWFEDPRNGWPPNAPETIVRKGSSAPLIDTSKLRNSIVYVVKEA